MGSVLKYLSFLTAGESHGPQLTVILQNFPAGLELLEETINADLGRRQRGYGRGGRQKIERDRVQIVGGVRHGLTMGGPVALVIPNLDWPNWVGSMDVGPVEELFPKVTRLRPGHADLAGVIKYRLDDVRNVLERASARETAARVAAGAVARVFLAALGVEIRSHVRSIEAVGARSPDILRLDPTGSFNPLVQAYWRAVEESEVRCADAEAEVRMAEAIQRARTAGDTVGGVFETIAYGLPIGLGSHTQWDEKLDGRLAAALMSIQSVKGVELGDGFSAAGRRGSTVHDPITYDREHGWSRPTNSAGGLEGGITNGMPVVARAAVKPISTLIHPLPSVDFATLEAQPAHVERSDVCVVPAAGVVGEAMVALVLADAFRQKFGGDAMDEVRRNVRSYVSGYGPAQRE